MTVGVGDRIIFLDREEEQIGRVTYASGAGATVVSQDGTQYEVPWGAVMEKARGGTKYVRKYWKDGRWNYVYPKNGATRQPRKIPEHSVVKNLGGTTGGALLIEFPNGEQKVMKRSTGPKHLRDEYTANRIYAILGVPVPDVQLRIDSKGVAQIADFVKGTPMSDLSPDEREQAVESLKRGFVADALLGNWDVLGMDDDNILWDGSKAWRIDNGGSLRYRAQGQPKGEKFSGSVGELESMRRSDRGAGRRAYHSVTDEEIDAQIRDVVARRQTILDAIDSPGLRKTMESRLNCLEARVSAKKSTDRLGSGPLLIKSHDGDWFLYENGFATQFFWFHGLEKAAGSNYYTSDDIAELEMCWDTVQGARVLLKSAPGGYAVVGGAGGRLATLSKRKTYKVGEVSTTTGLKKIAPGKWVAPEGREKKAEEPKISDKAKWLLDSGTQRVAKSGELVQPTGDIDELYKMSEDVRDEFRDLVSEAKDKLGATKMHSRKELKGRKRILEKIKESGDPDARNINDIDGHTLEFDDLDKLADAVKYFMDRPDVIQVKNKFGNPTSEGYRDVNIRIQLSNGVVSELQLNMAPMMVAKESIGHVLYEVVREGELETPPPPPPPPCGTVTEMAQKIYSGAWSVITRERARSSDNLMASLFEMAEPQWRKAAKILEETDANWLSDSTRKRFQDLGSKAKGTSSFS